MLLIALLIVALVFGLLFFGRLAGARRALIMERWPAFLLGALALFTLVRGGFWLAVALAAAAWIAFWLTAPRAGIAPDDAADAEAQRILGVPSSASEEEIRAAYRAKMASAHPDRGGAHHEAARLTAARDRLLKRRKR